MYSRFAILLLIFCWSFSLHAQEITLPRHLTHSEKLLLKSENYVRPIGPTGAFSEPPTSPVRSIAEWEELQALVISWTGYESILAEIVRHARLECNVIVCVKNTAQETNAKAYLTSKGVDISTNVQFVVRNFNTIWVRDYGPNGVYTNDVDSLLLVDWIYNRPRPADDTLSVKIAQTLGVPLYTTTTAPLDLVHTGGNFMSDGLGLGFSSELVLEENGPGNDFGTSNHSESDIDSIMARFMGINTYIKMQTLPFDGIHHIDMHMKLLDEQTLLVGQYPNGVADGPQIEANINYVLDNFKSSYGTPFQVIRVPMPPEGLLYPNNGGDYRTYTNAIFINKTILVPTYGIGTDSVALQIWRTAMPGYKVVGINCNAIIPDSGALHCITKEMGTNEPLWITYKRIDDVPDNTILIGYDFEAKIKHKSGISAANLFYRLKGDSLWLSVPLTESTMPLWTGSIPHLPDGSEVQYFVEAVANSGKTINRPITAPEGFHTFRINQSSSTQIPEVTFTESAYPNPAKAITCVPITSTHTMQAQIQLVNSMGVVVETVFEGTLNVGTSRHYFDAKGLPNGAYQIRLTTTSGVFSQKLIVIK